MTPKRSPQASAPELDNKRNLRGSAPAVEVKRNQKAQSANVKCVTHERNLARSRSFVWVAAAAGTVHAGFSLYWALGGQWLLPTVGKWAVELSVEAPLGAGLALGAVAAGKLLGAGIPVGVAYGRVPWPRFWRSVAWAGGSCLVMYGGVNVVVSSAVLAGLIRPAGGYDVEAMMGHAWLWDPLFFIWGAALVLSLWYSQRRPAPAPRTGSS